MDSYVLNFIETIGIKQALSTNCYAKNVNQTIEYEISFPSLQERRNKSLHPFHDFHCSFMTLDLMVTLNDFGITWWGTLARAGITLLSSFYRFWDWGWSFSWC